MDLKNIKLLDFYNFIYDRQLVWYKRTILKQPYPWTDDPILKTYKFCNTYRELDKGTMYLIEAIINNKRIPLGSKLLNCMIYRRFNLPGFFEWIDGPILEKGFFPFDNLIFKLEKRKAKGLNLFNDAYIVSQTPYDRKIGRKEKFVQQLCIFRDLMNKSEYTRLSLDIITSRNLKNVHSILKDRVFGMGDFLAYQTVTDLTYFPEFKGKWDINSFVAMGPGSKPGVELIYNTRPIDYAERCHELWRCQDFWFDKLKKETSRDWNKIKFRKPYFKSEYLSLSNIQNCLCEFRKMVMLQRDPNKRKRYYKWITT